MHPKFEERRTRLAAERQFSVQNDLTHAVVSRVVESAQTLRALIGQDLAKWNPHFTDDDVTSASLDLALWIERVDEAYRENRSLIDVFKQHTPASKQMYWGGDVAMSSHDEWEFQYRETDIDQWSYVGALLRVMCPVSGDDYYLMAGGILICVTDGEHGPEAEAYCYE